MDEYHCSAYPHISASDIASETPLRTDANQCFSVEVEYTNMYVLSASEFKTSSDVTSQTFSNISKDEIMQEATVVSWLCAMGVPSDAHRTVAAKVQQCARGMASDRTAAAVLSMRVELTVTRASEDEASDFEYDYFQNEDDLEEDDDDDHGLVPAERSHFERLETVEEKENKKCMICLEDFSIGVRLPCLHLFHKNCIGDWLQVGNCCPLCRFQFPS